MENIHFLFIFFQSITAIFIFLSTNPMHAILFMILLFFESAIVLAFFGLEFFSILFIIVYVGAIAILFLFIVMLLTVKFNNTKAFWSIFFFNFWNIICIFYGEMLFNQILNKADSFFFNVLNFTFELDVLHDLHIIAQILYNYYILCFLIAGLILLVALVGAISISYDFNEIKINKGVFRKLSRSSNFLAFFQ